MRRESIIVALTGLLIITLACTAFAMPTATLDRGTTQISGLAEWPDEGECTDPEGDGSDYAVTMTGDLEGCHYTFVLVSQCRPGGAYFESGIETFVGTFHGSEGTFGTNYVFTAVYENCQEFSGERVGRCQHPLAPGTGTGVFLDATGRVDMKDDTEAGNFPYRGHITFADELFTIGAKSYKYSPDLMDMSLTGGGC